MKLLVFFAALLAVASAVNPAALYRSRCSEGSSYWCETAVQANECGAVEYCIQNQWRGKLVQVSGICSNCEAFVNGVHNVLEQTSVQTLILAGAKQACVVMGPLSPVCKQVVGTLGAEVLKKLVDELTADEVCHVLGFCKGLQVQLESPVECTVCKLFMTQVHSILSQQSTQQKIEDKILSVCPLVQRFLPNCETLVKGFYPTIIQLVLQYASPQVCTQLGLCSGDFNGLKLLENLKLADDSCTNCENFFTDVSGLLTNVTVQKLIISGLDTACGFLGSFAEECKSAVDQYSTLVMNFIASYIDPPQICTALTFCNAEDIPLKTFNMPADTCTDCKSFVADLSSLLTNQTVQNLIIHNVDEVCEKLGSFAAQCKSYVDQYGYLVFEFVASELDPATDCAAIGFCPKSLIKPKTKKVTADPTVCNDCLAFFTDVDAVLNNKTIQQDLITQLELLCALTGDLEAECKLIVQTYVPLAFEYLTTALVPETACTELGLCPGTAMKEQLNAPLIQPMTSLVAAKPLPQAAKPQPLVTPSEDSAGEFCVLCETIVGLVLKGIENNETEEEILNALSDLCDVLPDGDYRTECKNMVHNYGYLIFEFLNQGLTPEKICTEIGYCTSTGKLSSVETQKIMAEYKRLLRQLPVADTPLCSFCELVVQEVDTILSSNKSEEEIKAEFEKYVCGNLPSPVDQQCVSFMSIYGDVLIQLLVDQLNPTSLCADIGLCDSKSTPKAAPVDVEASAQCVLCELMVTELDKLITENSTESEIKAALDAVCDKLPTTLRSDCETLVNEYTTDIINYLVQKWSPQALCTALKICSSTQVIDVENPEDCILCEYVMTELEKALADNATEAEIAAILDKICSYIPDATLSKECVEFANNMLPLILEFLSQELGTPKEFCTKFGFCDAVCALAEVKPKVTVPETTKPEASVSCTICEFAIRELDNELGQNATQAEIEKALETLCDKLPTTVRAECETFVKLYTPMIIDAFLKETPDKLCTSIGVCGSAIKREMAKRRKADCTVTCEICKLAMNKLETMLSDNTTQAEIQKALNNICNVLPESVKGKCITFVALYEPAILELLLQHFTPDKVCSGLGICTSSLKTRLDFSIGCDLCQLTWRELLDAIQEPVITKDIVTVANDTCAILPPDLSATCYMYVTEYGDLVTTFIAQFFDPITTCTLLGECPYPSNEPVSPQKPLLGMKECTRGPGYWCASMDNARQCGMVKHCERHVWN